MSGLKKDLGLWQGMGLLATSLLGTGIFVVPATAASLAGVGDMEHAPNDTGPSSAGAFNRWLFAGGDRQVRDVMVNGQWVVRQGRHAQEEESGRAFAEVLRQLLG